VDEVRKHVRRAAETLFGLADLPLMLEALVSLSEVTLAGTAALASKPDKGGRGTAERSSEDAVGLAQAYWREAWQLFGHMHLRNTDIALRMRAPLATLERIEVHARRLVRLLLLFGGTFAADNVFAFEVRACAAPRPAHCTTAVAFAFAIATSPSPLPSPHRRRHRRCHRRPGP